MIEFREAELADLATIVALLADDPLGAGREQASAMPEKTYQDAFAAIERDPNNQLIVAEIDGRVLAVLQLTLIPHLTYRGGWRAQVEGIRVASGFRGRGVGRSMLRWAIEQSRERGCHLVQLTTDKARPDAIAFYRSIGFESTHEGMKLHLEQLPKASP